MDDWRKAKILAVAKTLLASDGRDTGGASTGELIAGALLSGRPEWGGYTQDDGYTDVIAMIDRLGPNWYALVRELQDTTDFGES